MTPPWQWLIVECNNIIIENPQCNTLTMSCMHACAFFFSSLIQTLCTKFDIIITGIWLAALCYTNRHYYSETVTDTWALKFSMGINF